MVLCIKRPEQERGNIGSRYGTLDRAKAPPRRSVTAAKGCMALKTGMRGPSKAHKSEGLYKKAPARSVLMGNQ
jgi:hypothetical protein